MTLNSKQKHIILFLNDTLKAKQSKNKSYSMRAFAKQIGINHSQLSKIFSGKSPLTFSLADRILDALDVALPIKNSLLLSLSDEKNVSEEFHYEDVVVLDPSQTEILRQWYSISVICCFNTSTIEPTVSGISKYLGITPQQVIDSLEVFKILGSVKEENGRYTYNNTCYRVKQHNNTDEQKKHVIEAQQNTLENMNKSITHDHDNCVFQTDTFAMPLAKLPEAKRKITELRRELSTWMASNEEKDCDNVFRLVVSLYRTINFADSEE